MLGLKSDTSERWLQQVDEHLDEILIDHAHCENKAARTAMNLLIAYVENAELCRAMTEIVQEELEHFHLTRDMLEARGIAFRKLKPSSYGRRLHEMIRKEEPQRAVDRLLVAGLIEARSCERFSCLRDRVQDADLAAFYGGLFESEARHHTTYVRLAEKFQSRTDVQRRLDELSDREAAIIQQGDPFPRMHS